MLLNHLPVILEPSPLVPMPLCTDARGGWREVLAMEPELRTLARLVL